MSDPFANLPPATAGALIIGVVVVAITLRAWHRHRLGEASRRWPRTRGTVVDIWFDVQDKSDADGGTYVSTDAHLTYEYVVAGRRFRSKRFTYRPSRGLGEREAYALLSGIRKGQEVDVRYDPRRPARAVVLPGTHPGSQWTILGGIVIACIAFGYAAMHWRVPAG
jgi:hypothetical protein